MARVTEIGTGWKATNYVGELFAADMSQTPLLSMIGGLTGGRQTTGGEFPTAVLFDYPTAKDKNISKTEKEHETNVVQRYEGIIDLSYLKMSSNDDENLAADEKAFQLYHRLVMMAREVEHSFLNGSFQKATDMPTENKTRGLIELTGNGTTIDAGGGMLTKRMLDALYNKMAENGAYFDNMVMFLPAFQKQMITDIYARQFNAVMGMKENIGGVSVTQIETDYFKMGIVWDRLMPKDTILITDVAHLAPVFLPIEDKGVVFEETIEPDKIRICSHIGLAHGPAFLHGSITNLSIG